MDQLDERTGKVRKYLGSEVCSLKTTGLSSSSHITLDVLRSDVFFSICEPLINVLNKCHNPTEL